MSEKSLTASTERSTEPVSTEVVTAVAEARDADPLDLPPLYLVIDPDALDELFRPQFHSAEPRTGQVQFTFAGCEVVVDGADRVTATPIDSGAESGPDA